MANGYLLCNISCHKIFDPRLKPWLCTGLRRRFCFGIDTRRFLWKMWNLFRAWVSVSGKFREMANSVDCLYFWELHIFRPDRSSQWVVYVRSLEFPNIPNQHKPPIKHSGAYKCLWVLRSSTKTQNLSWWTGQLHHEPPLMMFVCWKFGRLFSEAWDDLFRRFKNDNRSVESSNVSPMGFGPKSRWRKRYQAINDKFYHANLHEWHRRW